MAIILRLIRSFKQRFKKPCRLLDNALDGHYDEVKWQDQALVVIDFMGEQVGQVTSETSLVDEFKANADQLTDRLAQATEQIVGGR